MDLIEAMARGICAKQLYPTAWDALHERAQESYRTVARAALTAAEAAGWKMVPVAAHAARRVCPAPHR